MTVQNISKICKRRI